MSLTGAIFASYRSPGRMVSRLLKMGRREDRALTILVVACLLLFTAQAPWQARQAVIDHAVPLSARLYWSGLFLLFILPIFAYAIAAASHIAARLLGGQGSWYGARLALFWAMLAISPLALLIGLSQGMAPGPGADALGVVGMVVFLWLWLAGLRQAEKEVGA